ncbi:acyltransferase family protein [Arcicella lustrica]|uniref:Acyltransferase n=1 Tax=Arcicella lustrica TaxID=2984196 RepID=A0ABU5SMH6_9BACT|nr:acyltransferase [Arcicella sp. DC25W]MEA5428501.1 acyltransferase [Arcicella sp. DC25W]
MISTTPKRNQSIDFLRTIAVSLTLFRHFKISNFLHKIGWIGVDLFFVLSGLLVSGLLFNEYKKTRKINFVRFFVRRGLKIYPLFYLLFIAVVIHTQLHPEFKISIRHFVAEAFFLKNYFGTSDYALIHTWSIDVEEHFYFILPILLIILIFFNKESSNPFKAIPFIFMIITLICLALRIYVNHIEPQFDHLTHVAPTHLRIDSLFFGTMLAYFYNFHFENLNKWVNKYRRFILLNSILLLSPAIILWDNNLFMRTFGFITLYLAFGGIILLSLFSKNNLTITTFVFNFIANLGFYSYATYIIHFPIYLWYIHPHLDYLDSHLSLKLIVFISYFMVSFIGGWLLSFTIEIPFLALRDKLFPSNSKAL